MKKILITLGALSVFAFTSCGLLINAGLNNQDSSGNNNSGSNPYESSKITYISSNYWGKWQRMDTGEYFYIDNHYVYKGETPVAYSSWNNNIFHNGEFGMDKYQFDGENILKVTDKNNNQFLLFRVGGGSRSFTAAISGMDKYANVNGVSRAIATIGNYKGNRTNVNNSSDTQEVSPTQDGTLTFTGAVAGDAQTITITSADSSNAVTGINITPEYDGENIGTIPIIEKGSFGFKTSYTIDSDEQGFCYGNNTKTYKLKLNFVNIGDSVCGTSRYKLSCDDPKFQILDGKTSKTLNTLEPGKGEEVELSVRYGEVLTGYTDVKISIDVTSNNIDLVTGENITKIWRDSVVVRFYKGMISFSINAKNINPSNTRSNLNGYFIFPDKRAKRFEVDSGKTTNVMIPWSEKDYILAFSGATADTEMAYSFGFTKMATLDSLTDIDSDEWFNEVIIERVPNNSSSTAERINDVSKAKRGYLQYGDLDFYIINCKDVEM